ncbi:hypothetical protein [Rhodococcus sp. JG-3]|uniref:hypothetical protein n=1 Tax=Rhodococcus sp. JG-3 TaxID=1305835 RepID=UPI0004852FED|nr:hypothetical protein [Rhodococcus sp. JG-3]
MDSIFWLGLLLGAIMGQSLQYLARPFERFLDRRLAERITRQATRLNAASRDEQSATRDWLVVQLLEIALIGAITGAAGGVLFGISNASAASADNYQDWGRWLALLGQIVIVAGAAITIKIAGDAISSARALVTIRSSQAE